MTIQKFKEQIDFWSEWANCENNQRYDISLMKIYVQFEKFISELFIDYCLGKQSEKKYEPNRLLEFNNLDQLNKVLCYNSNHINYVKVIEHISGNLFDPDPFDILKTDSIYVNSIREVFLIRNFVAHESIESKGKYIKTCLKGEYIEPSDYLLLHHKKKTGPSNFTTYCKDLLDVAKLLVDPINL